MTLADTSNEMPIQPTPVSDAHGVARCLQFKACPDGTAAGLVSLPTPNAIYETMFNTPHQRPQSPLEQAARRWAAAKRDWDAVRCGSNPGSGEELNDLMRAEAALLAAVGE